MRRARAGLALLEVLIALGVLVVVLGLTVGYLRDQHDLARLGQARSEAQDKARVAMALITQDLEMAGSSRYVSVTASGSTTTTYVPTSVPNWTECNGVPPCLQGRDNGTTDELSMRYVTSLRDLAEACRRVRYDVASGTLRRSDVGCGQGDDLQPLAANVLAANVYYRCTNGQVVDAPASLGAPVCASTASGSVRSIAVTVVARSDEPLPGTHQGSAAAVRSAGGASPVAAGSMVSTPVACPARFYCYALEQEVLSPNLKEN